MNPVLIQQSERLEKIGHQLRLRLLYVFGSFARGDMHPQSDIDIAYASEKPLSPQELVAFQEELQSILQTGSRSIDLVNIKNATPLLARLISNEGQLLFGSPQADDQFYRKSIKQYVDAQPLLLATQEYVRQRLAFS